MEQDTTASPSKGAGGPEKRQSVGPRLRLGALIAVAAVIGVVGWLLVRGGGGSTSNPQRSSVAGVSEQGLRTLAGSLGSPIYWAGPQSGINYELTQTPSGRVFVRYLPKGVAVRTAKQFLFVASFPVPNAFQATSGVAKRADSIRIRVGNGAVAFYSRSSPTNVYLAFRGSNYQIEVFDPDPSVARQLVAQGRITPVSSSSRGPVSAPAVTAVSLASLKALPGKLGHPIYWAGTRNGVTYELTQTATGRVFVRYLPTGTGVGTSKQYPFVATFPVQNAFKATQNVANRQNSVKIPVGGGAVAFYSSSSPTNVYVAFPGSNYQIEVFDPNPRLARQLVLSGAVQAIH